jgi:hypothetical protein
MSKGIMVFCVLMMAVPLVSGCWFLVGAGAGGATVYEVSTGTVTANYDVKFERAYRTSLDVLRSRGKTTMEDSVGGWVKADIGERDAAVHIERLTDKASKVTVSARKGVMPEGEFARNIMNDISAKLR